MKKSDEEQRSGRRSTTAVRTMCEGAAARAIVTQRTTATHKCCVRAQLLCKTWIQYNCYIECMFVMQQV